LIIILAINCEFFCKENRSVIASISCFHFYANVINVNCIDKDLLLKTSVLFAKQILTSNLNNETKQKQITDMLSQRNIRTFNWNSTKKELIASLTWKSISIQQSTSTIYLLKGCLNYLRGMKQQVLSLVKTPEKWSGVSPLDLQLSTREGWC